MYLGVNIDHVATVRQARGEQEPDPVAAAYEAERGGAHGITVHLREDRRHIQERDIALLLQTVTTKLNVELSLDSEVVQCVCGYKPACACLVPERREEVTTEGGLDVAGQESRVRDAVQALSSCGTLVSLFIEPDMRQIEAAAAVGAPYIELHTGAFSRARADAQIVALTALIDGAQRARECGLRVNAGHGLNYHNVHLMHRVPGLEELNIGHALIARSLFTGLACAVREMVALIT